MSGGTPLGNMVIQLGLDSTKMTDSLTKARNQLKTFEQQVKAQNGLASFYQKGGQAAQAYQKQQLTLNKAIETQSQLLKKLKASYDEEVAANGAMSKKAQRLAGQIEIGNGKLAQYAGQLQNVAKQAYLASSRLNVFGEKAYNFGSKLQVAGGIFDNISNSTRGLSVAVLGGMGLATKAAIEFEDALAGVKKTVNPTETELSNLSAEIREMAKELPASTTKIANVAEAAGQLGIKKENIMEFTRTMIDMGVATNLTSTDAATTLAKFQNITQMSQRDFGKLGSVVVHLGNNMATTEQDITDMGLRLASTGKLVGLTEAQIMALAATLSSTGMEAEAGGSSISRVMQKMNTAVADNGDRLKDYAAVSGLAAEEFAAKWKTKPTEAIMAFLAGLRRIKQEGGDVTGTLKSLKINSIREIDSLQRLAGANNLLAESLGYAEKAWSGQNRLTQEASTRYETMKSKVQIVKNKINDAAITLGGPMLEALADTIDAGEPVIQHLAGMAEAFSKMDKSSQQSILKWGLLAVSISPVSKLFGSTLNTVGALSKGIGSLSKRLAMAGAERAGMAAIEGLGTSAVTSTSAVSGLTGAVGILANPTTWGFLVGGAAIGAIAYFANEAEKAQKRTEMWGTEVSELEASQLTRLKDKVADTKKAMSDFASGATKEVGDVKKAFESLSGEIQALADKELSKNLKVADKLGLSDTVKNSLKNAANSTKQEAEQLTAEVVNIYQKHANDVKALSEDEKTIVLNAQTELISKRLELEGYSSKQIISIRKAMNGDLSKMTAEQADSWAKTSRTWIEQENKTFEANRDSLKKVLSEITGTDEQSLQAKKELYSKVQTLESEHNIKIDGYRAQNLEALKRWYTESMKTARSDEQRALINANLVKYLTSLNMSYDEFVRTIGKAEEKTKSTNAVIAESTGTLSANVKKANEDWKALIWDEKKAEVKSNSNEILIEAIKSESGWNNLQFIIKNANLTSNAKDMVRSALVEVGKWDSLDPQIKQLLAQDKTYPATESARANIMGVPTNRTTYFTAVDNISSTVDWVHQKLATLENKRVNVNIDPSVGRLATGTNFHPGGLAMVNDQKGPTYRELVALPNGESFIPEGRDVILPLPRGSKVLKASRTKELMARLGVPRYADGVGVPVDAPILQNFEHLQRSRSNVVSPVNNELIRLVKEILSLLNTRDVNDRQMFYNIIMDKKEVGRIISEEQERQSVYDKLAKGVKVW